MTDRAVRHGLTAHANEDRPLRGILMMLAAFFFFSFIDTGAKWLGALAIPALQLSFMRFLGHFVISTGLILRGGVSAKRFATPHAGLVILRGLLLMGSTIFNFFAIRHLPLTLTSTILFSAPIIICALSWPLLGERVGIWRVSAILAGFGGILVAIRPFDDSFHWAVFLSLLGALCFALYAILTRKLSGKVAIDSLQFYSGLVGTLVLLPFAILEWQNPETAFQWAVMVCLGFFGWIGHEVLTRAHRFAPASTLTPFSYSFIMYLTVWSILVFGHVPDIWTITGAGIIVISGLVIWMRERRFSRA